MTAQTRYDDNTRISAYKDCPRKYFLRHVMHWRSSGTAMPLVFGSSWHAAMDLVWLHAKTLPPDDLVAAGMAGFYEKWIEEGMPEDMDSAQLEAIGIRNPGVAEDMLHCYIADRRSVLQNCTLLSGEQGFAVPLPNMDQCWYVGKLDKVIEYQGQKLVIEHKSTTEYKKDGGFKSQYIEGWYSDSQVKGYQFGAGLYYPGLTQVWVDAALVHKTVHDAFRFVPVAHSFPIIKEWLDDTQSWIGSMQADEQYFEREGKLTPGNFRKNENSCMGKFGPCPYLDICMTTPDPSALEGPPEGYIVEPWEPFKILELDKVLNKDKETK